jgi:hypothetical protein
MDTAVTRRPDGWFVVAATYATADQARAAWERIEAAPWRPGAGLGVIRLSGETWRQPDSNCPPRRHPVVGVTTNEEAAAKLAHALADGEPWRPWKDMADALVNRRIRVLSLGPAAVLQNGLHRDTRVHFERGRVQMRRPEPGA